MMMNRVGLFGGTFNPVHIGHRNSVCQVTEALELDRVIVMPTFKSPHRELDNSVSSSQRLAMTKLAFDGLEFVEVSDHESLRGGVSYTIDTIDYLLEAHQDTEFFLIIGADQFLNFSQWKSYQKILEKTNLVVTSRPGCEINYSNKTLFYREVLSAEETNNKLETWVTEYGNKISVVRLDDIDVSSSVIIQRLHTGESVLNMLDEKVISYIENEKVYPPIKENLKDFELFTQFCAKILDDGKAVNVVGKDLREEDKPMEFALISSGTSKKHAISLAENLIRKVKTEFKTNPINIDGQAEGQWIVIDYGSLIVHVFYDFTRQEYQLEQLWSSSKTMELSL